MDSQTQISLIAGGATVISAVILVVAAHWRERSNRIAEQEEQRRVDKLAKIERTYVASINAANELSADTRYIFDLLDRSSHSALIPGGVRFARSDGGDDRESIARPSTQAITQLEMLVNLYFGEELSALLSELLVATGAFNISFTLAAHNPTMDKSPEELRQIMFDRSKAVGDEIANLQRALVELSAQEFR